jgi:hypothetical protein
MLLQRQHHSTGCAAIVLLVAVLCQPATLAAQDAQRPSFVVDLAKSVAFDPTTYAPGVLSHHAAVRDWDTSQPLFRHGYLELNPRFTVSGLPEDVPVSYDAGRRIILKDALMRIQVSAIHNVTSRSLERVLLERHPERRKLIRILGWIERTAFASYVAYELSVHHYRQARENERLASANGFR